MSADQPTRNDQPTQSTQQPQKVWRAGYWKFHRELNRDHSNSGIAAVHRLVYEFLPLPGIGLSDERVISTAEYGTLAKSPNEHEILAAASTGFGGETDLSCDNEILDRIVACVNACRDFTNEKLAQIAADNERFKESNPETYATFTRPRVETAESLRQEIRSLLHWAKIDGIEIGSIVLTREQVRLLKEDVASFGVCVAPVDDALRFMGVEIKEKL